MSFFRRLVLKVLICSFVFSGAAQAQAPKGELDHLLWATPDLEDGAAQMEKLLGVEPVFGGVHPGRGTANQLLSLGDDFYLEIYGPDPNIDEPKDSGVALAALEAPGLWEFAVRSDDLDAIAAAGRAIGFTVNGPRAGSRAKPDGSTLSWRALSFSGHDFGRMVPFFIAWTSTPHPAETSPDAGRLISLTAIHPQAEELRKIYAAIGAPVRVTAGVEPGFIAEIETPNGAVTLNSVKMTP